MERYSHGTNNLERRRNCVLSGETLKVYVKKMPRNAKETRFSPCWTAKHRSFRLATAGLHGNYPN